MNNYKISVIIPVYNVEPYIEACLLSVAHQTMTYGVECIIVDDCGTDASIQIVSLFVENYNGNVTFTILHHDCNRGLSEARNSGLKAAHGEYVYFLDSDDEITPGCLRHLWSLVGKYDYPDVVQGMIKSYPTDSNRPDFDLPEYTNDHRVIKNFFLTYRGDVMPAQSKLVRLSVILDKNLFFKEGVIHEDNLWTFFMAKHVHSLAYCREREYLHRNNPNSITHKKNLEKEIISYRNIIEIFCSNIDSFLPGRQKMLILQTLLTVFQNKYYDSDNSKEHLISIFQAKHTLLEKCIFNLYLKLPYRKVKQKIYRLLSLLYACED